MQSMGAIRAALFAAAVLALFLAAPAPSDDVPPAHGRELLGQFALPVDSVLETASGGVAPADKSAVEPAADGLPRWTGPLQDVGVGRNPYKLVVTLLGTTRGAGEVRARWQGGWDVRESAQATREVRMPAVRAAASASGPGLPLTLTMVGRPLSFRGERQVAALLHQVAASNLDVHDVQLQVWSGPAPIGLASLSVQRPLLLVVALLCVVGGWLLRRRPAERPRDAVDTRLPVVRGTHVDAANSLLPCAPQRDPAPAIDALLEHHWPEEQRVRAVPSAPVPPAAAAPAPRVSPSACVVAALHDVLRGGLAVPAQADTRVRPSRRAPGAAAQG
jgi:hypothetical protein